MKWIVERNEDGTIAARKLQGTNVMIKREFTGSFKADSFTNMLIVNGEWYKMMDTSAGSGYTLKDLMREGERISKETTWKN